MEKSKSYFIEFLDSGFIIRSEGKTQAIENSNKVRELLKDDLIKLVSKLDYASTNNMAISITVEENTPLVSTR